MGRLKEQSKIQPREQETPIHPDGRLLVISGRPAAGKDFVAALLEQPEFSQFNLSRLVTCASRPPRLNAATGRQEVHGVDYIFVSPEELERMEINGELVEKRVPTGNTHKATPKSQFHDILYQGKRLYWRIEPYLAARVAEGSFFDEMFTVAESEHLKKITLVVYVDAPEEVLNARRIARDGQNFQPEVYLHRDAYEKEIISRASDVFANILNNLDDNVEETKQRLFELVNSLMLR